MFLTPYQTTAMNGAQLSSVADTVAMAERSGELIDIGEGIKGISPRNRDIPILIQPVTKADLPRLIAPMVLDTRLLLKMRNEYPGDDAVEVRSESEYESMVNRGKILYRYMSDGGREDLLRINSDVPASMFSALVARTISHRYGLTVDDFDTLRALTLLYYFGLHLTAEEYHRDLSKLIHRVARITRLPERQLQNLLSEVPYIEDLDNFAVAIQKTIPTSRLNSVSSNLMFQILTGGWFGAHARTHMAVALEHPPTWVWLVHLAIASRTYKRTILGKLAQEVIKRQDGDEFDKLVKIYMR